MEGMLYTTATGSGKTLSMMEMAFALHDAGKASRGLARRVRRNIGELDRLRGDLERNGIQLDVITTPPAAVPPADMTWQRAGRFGVYIASEYHGVSRLSAGSEPVASGHVLPDARTLFTSGSTGEPVIFLPPYLVSARGVSYLAIGEFREDLVRLVDSLRAALRLVLIRVSSALSRHQDIPAFSLVFLATSRRYGHRGEPDDHVSPALRTMSVVGVAVCSV